MRPLPAWVRSKGLAVALLFAFGCVHGGGFLGFDGSAATTVPPIAQTLTVSAAIQSALEQSAAMQSAGHALAEAELGEKAVRAGLGLRADLIAHDRLSDAGANQGVPPSDPRRNVAFASLSVRTHLAPGRSGELDLLQASIGIDEARIGLEEAARETIVSVFDAYHQLQAAVLQLRVLERRLGDSRRAVAIAEARHESGALTQTELETARLNLRQATSAHDGALRMLEVAKSRLARLIGVDPEAIATDDLPVGDLAGLLDAMQARSAAFFPPAPFPWSDSKAELLAQALKARPEVLRTESAVALADLAISRARLTSRPQVEATAEYAWSDKTQVAFTLDNDWLLEASLSQTEDSSAAGGLGSTASGSGWSVGVQLVFNLWDSGLERIAVMRAREAKERADRGLRQARDGVELDVRRRYDDVLAAYDALTLAADRALLASATLRTELERNDLGLSTSSQVAMLSTQRDQAVLDAVIARYRYETALLNMAKAAAFSPERMMELVARFEGGLEDGSGG